jgi:hypothetical protein
VGKSLLNGMGKSPALSGGKLTNVIDQRFPSFAVPTHQQCFPQASKILLQLATVPRTLKGALTIRRMGVHVRGLTCDRETSRAQQCSRGALSGRGGTWGGPFLIQLPADMVGMQMREKTVSTSSGRTPAACSSVRSRPSGP